MVVTKLDKRWGLRLVAYLANRMLREIDSDDTDNAVPAGNSEKPNSHVTHPGYLGTLAEAEFRQRRQRDKLFPEEIFSDPAWDIMLDLFAREHRGKQTSVTSACIASNVPPTTALRHIYLLEELGLLAVVPCSVDRRRKFVELTPLCRERLMSHFDRQADIWDKSAGWLLKKEEPRKDLVKK